MMPELYLAPALGAVGKPMFRVHTAGSVGGSTALVAAHLVTAGIHKRVLTVAFEKQSDSDAMWALSVPQPFAAPLLAGAGGYFAPHIRAYMRRSGAPDHIGMMVAVKDRLNALKNPYAHLHLPDIYLKKVRGLGDAVGPAAIPRDVPFFGRGGGHGPVRRGAVADAAWPAGVGPRHGHAVASPTMFAGRDQVNPQAGRDCAADVFAQAGITDPRAEIDMAEVYVPFSWYEPMWLENLGFAEEGDGWKLTEAGATALDGWTCRGTARVASCRRTPSGRRACSASWRRPCRCGARPASTRWTVSGGHSARPTGAGRSSSPCGSWAATSPDLIGSLLRLPISCVAFAETPEVT